MHLPHTFYFVTFLLPTRSSFVKYFALVLFFCNLLRGSLKADACMMLAAQRRGFGCRRGSTTQGTIPQETDTHYTYVHTLPASLLYSLYLSSPHLLPSLVLLFHPPVLGIISYCCLYRLLICCWCCFSDETFFFWCWSCFLCSETAALHSAFCCWGWV